MTTEMGPRDVDLTLSERVAAHGTRYTTRLVASTQDDLSIRFTPSTATLSLSGESEHRGDAFNRGLLVASVCMVNIMLAFGAVGIAGEAMTAAAEVSQWLGLVSIVPFVLVATVGLVFGLGSAGLLFEIDVIDHTTEPAPDAVGELKERYVAGDLDDAELEREAAEVWER